MISIQVGLCVTQQCIQSLGRCTRDGFFHLYHVDILSWKMGQPTCAILHNIWVHSYGGWRQSICAILHDFLVDSWHIHELFIELEEEHPTWAILGRRSALFLKLY
jgi:hypothetical protein